MSWKQNRLMLSTWSHGWEKSCSVVTVIDRHLGTTTLVGVISFILLRSSLSFLRSFLQRTYAKSAACRTTQSKAKVWTKCWALLAYGTLRVAGRPCYRRKSRAIAVDNVPAIYILIRASFVFDESKCILIFSWKYQDINIQDFHRTVSKDSMAWSFRVRILYTFASISECM